MANKLDKNQVTSIKEVHGNYLTIQKEERCENWKPKRLQVVVVVNGVGVNKIYFSKLISLIKFVCSCCTPFLLLYVTLLKPKEPMWWVCRKTERYHFPMFTLVKLAGKFMTPILIHSSGLSFLIYIISFFWIEKLVTTYVDLLLKGIFCITDYWKSSIPVN